MLSRNNPLQAENAAILRTHGFSDAHPCSFRSDSPEDGQPSGQGAGAASEGESGREDLRSLCVFTMDEEKTKDMDDAVSCEDLGDGVFEVGVHISDVSYLVPEGSDIDVEAKRRASSVYLVKKDVHMLPAEMATDACSLLQGQDRHAVSFFWKVNQADGFKAGKPKMHRSLINSCARMTFDQAESLLMDRRLDEPLEPSNSFTLTDVGKRLKDLNKITKQWLDNNFDNGDLPMGCFNPTFIVNQEQMPKDVQYADCRQSDRIIAELMTFTNECVAQRLCHFFPEGALLKDRTPTKRENVVSEAAGLELNINRSTYDSMLQSLGRNSDTKLQVLNSLVWKKVSMGVQQQRKYFVGASGVVKGSEPYAGCTSPIRRYADLIAQRQLLQTLDPEDDAENVPRASVTSREIERMAERERECNAAQRDSENAFYKSLVKRTGRVQEEAIVKLIRQPFFNVMLVRTRKYLSVNRERMREDHRVKWSLQGKDKRVMLTWPNGRRLHVNALGTVICEVGIDEDDELYCDVLPQRC